jgi:hypothetical protein
MRNIMPTPSSLKLGANFYPGYFLEIFCCEKVDLPRRRRVLALDVGSPMILVMWSFIQLLSLFPGLNGVLNFIW